MHGHRQRPRSQTFRHLWPRALRCFKEIARVGDEFYPERVKRCIIVNAPLIFAKMWSIIKVFFAQNTREKVSIVSGDPTSVLKKFIAPEATPAFIKGGKATVFGDPECRALINAGGRAPKQLAPSYDYPKGKPKLLVWRDNCATDQPFPVPNA